MIIIHLSGGLGNQLFQYAFGKSLEVRTNQKVFYDIQSFRWDELREFALSKFDFKNLNIATLESVNEIKKGKLSLKELLYSFFFKIPYYKHSYIKEPHFNYDPNFKNYKTKNVYFEGYWQSEKYFRDCRNALISEVRNINLLSEVSQKTLKSIQANENPISIHIRRGDYISNKVTNDFHGVCGLDYYKQAITLVKSKIENPHFFVFSDDKAYIEEVFVNSTSFTLIKNIPFDFEELILMSHCNHHIIANSSFSWWGAWLNPKKDKMVICPKQWFLNTEMQKQSFDIIPKEWIKI